MCYPLSSAARQKLETKPSGRAMKIAAICAVSGNVPLPDGVIDRQYVPCLDSALANVSALYLFDAAQCDQRTASEAMRDFGDAVCIAKA